MTFVNAEKAMAALHDSSRLEISALKKALRNMKNTVVEETATALTISNGAGSSDRASKVKVREPLLFVLALLCVIHTYSTVTDSKVSQEQEQRYHPHRDHRAKAAEHEQQSRRAVHAR